ncbi:MAG: DUF1990 domain-containing protein [Bacteroidota bacterium]
MICFRPPSSSRIDAFLQLSEQSRFSYRQTGQSISRKTVSGFDNDLNEVQLGHGQAVFRKASEAIRRWKMFPGGWAWIEPGTAPIKTGQNVAMVARVMGIYWVSNCRIVYVLDEEKPVRRFGFAYGTLREHVEKGEELFSVEWRADDSVWYVLRAFSKPRFWLARLAYPVARYFQRKFVKESLEKMKKEMK